MINVGDTVKIINEKKYFNLKKYDRLLGKTVIITERDTTENGSYMYHIKEDDGKFIWFDSDFQSKNTKSFNKITEKVINFITANGWVEAYSDKEIIAFERSGNISIDVLEDEIVLIGDEGDFYHINVNEHTLYTLIGILVDMRFIGYNYQK